MTMTRSSIFTFLNAYCSPFPVFLKPPVGGAGCEVPSIAACSFNFVLFSFFVVVVFLFSYMLGPCLADVRVLSAKAFICKLSSTL